MADRPLPRNPAALNPAPPDPAPLIYANLTQAEFQGLVERAHRARAAAIAAAFRRLARCIAAVWRRRGKGIRAQRIETRAPCPAAPRNK